VLGESRSRGSPTLEFYPTKSWSEKFFQRILKTGLNIFEKIFFAEKPGDVFMV